MWGTNEDITKANKNFNNLSEATDAILNEDNVDYWVEQDSVNALRANWKNANLKYNNGIYTSATQFAKNATKNAIDILEEGVIQTEDNSDEFLINIIIILIVVIVGIFLFEKFYLNKKKEGETIEYDAENY